MAYGAILGQNQSTKISDLQSQINNINSQISSLKSSAIPVGTIVIWSGATSNIPKNWQLCNGINGTPNLMDKFVLEAGNSYNVGNTGGEATHTLTINEIPSHNHTVNKSASSTGGGNGNYPIVSGTSPQGYNFTTQNTGGSQPHNNMPPYYALCYIMKIA